MLGQCSMSARHWVLMILLALFLLLHSNLLHAETLDPAPVTPPAAPSKDPTAYADPSAASHQQYWSLEPGIALTSTSLNIQGTGFRKGNHALLLDAPDSFQPVWTVDIMSPAVSIGKNVGLQLWLHGRGYNLRYQKYEDASFDASGEASDTSVVANLGTRIHGQYYSALPSIYYSLEKDSVGFRFGLGLGSSWVDLKGLAHVDNDWKRSILLTASGPNDLVSKLQAASIIQAGIDFSSGDRRYNTLLLTLDQPGGLERMGAYILSRGSLKTDLTSLYLLTYLTGNQLPGQLQLSPLEAIGAIGASRLSLDFHEQNVPTFFIYGQYSARHMVLRFSFGGPVFARNGFRYELLGIMVSLSVPIHG